MNNKKLLIIFLIITISFSLKGCSSVSLNNEIKADNLLKIHYIDVGQGDSILISINGKNMLIDSGSAVKEEYIVKYLKKQGIKKLHHVIATHPHEDHIGSMSSIISNFNVENFYAPKITSSTNYFNNMIDELMKKGLKIQVASSGKKIQLYDNVICEIIAPNSTTYENTNNYSVVLKLTYGKCSFIFTGDAEAISENEMLSNNTNLKCDVLKLGHHGSSTSTTDSFLEKASPKIAIISCGKNNPFRHPSKKTIGKIKSKDMQVYRTDIDGDIVLLSNGSFIKKQ
ncbi:ComEC family competence protein [Clostridium liquoris]|uniref:ComEC family competence protein n=1 Tax=Clostridium liquoris TaxID=1289519 RepID=A0A2T0B289_9CLOT|nr:ComEC/Rec2 family competence protein [Clostridium liquoris]PRR78014.1 ComEC family competence protein [Clostridium liquoris]